MSEFQLGLLGIGVTVVVAVMAFNKWQEIRYRRKADVAIKSNHSDVLLDLNSPAENTAAIGAAREEQAVGDAAAAKLEVGVPNILPTSWQVVKTQTELSSSISSAINLVAMIEAPLGLSLNELAISGLVDGFAKRICLEALSDGAWVMPSENIRYTSVNVGLQLANRQGPVSMQDLESFAEWVGQVVGRTGAKLAPLDLGAARRNALSLDQFCGDVDIQIAVHVIAGTASFPGTRIRAIAEAAGLTIDADGKFRRCDEDGRELFSLSNEGGGTFQAEIMRELTTASLILEFDVARSPGGNHAFSKFRHFAEHLASGLGGRIVDDNRAALDSAGFDAIAKELASIYQTMATRGILPGSPESLRLFS